MLFNYLYIIQGKNETSGLYPQQTENILALNPQLFCQQIDKKKLITGKMNC